MWIARLRAFVRRLVRSRRAERDLHDEVESYAALLADELGATGLAPEDASRRARAALGGVESVKESVRSIRTGAGLEQTWRDIGAAVRGLRRSTGFAVTAIVTIGLGIGVNTTLFSVIDGALFEPLPYERSHELVRLGHLTAGSSSDPTDLTLEELAWWREAPGLFQATGAFAGGRPRQWRERDESVVVGAFTTGVPALLGISPAIGRIFTADEARDDAPVIVIGDALWARAFNRRTEAIGATMTLDDRRLTIVGVLPPAFRYMFRSPPGIETAWTPLPESAAPGRPQRTVTLLMRLQSGLSLDAADERAAAVAARIQQARPEQPPWTAGLFPLDDFRRAGTSELRTPLLMLLATAGLVLLVACVNVANLILTRGAARREELALRVALGASRGRLVRLLLAEGIVVAGLGGAAAVLLATWTLDALVAFVPERLAYGMFQVSVPELDARVLLFAIVTTAAVALLSSLWPALRASRAVFRASIEVGPQIAGETRDRRRVTRMLQGVQIGLAFALAMVAGLFATSFATMLATDLGFDPRGLGAVRFTVSRAHYPTADAQRAAVAEAVDRVRATPGVLRAAIGDTPASAFVGDLYRPGDPNRVALSVRLVGPGYLDTAGIRLVSGRDFGPEDRLGSPLVAIIEEEGARRIFGDRSPIGQRFSHRPIGPTAVADTTIVGVAASVKRHDFTRPSSRAGIYLPEAQDDVAWPYFIFRTDRELPAALASVRTALESHDPSIRITSIGAATDRYETMETFVTPRFYLVLVSMFAVLALVTTSVGLYGLLAHAVGQRRREIGVRVTLGATPGQVRRLVLREALGPVIAGIAIGGLATWWTTGLIGSLLYGIGPRDPRALMAAAAALVLTSAVAAIVPVRRATGTDPVHALRLQ